MDVTNLLIAVSVRLVC